MGDTISGTDEFLLKSATKPHPTALPAISHREVLGRYQIEIRSGGVCRFDEYPTNHLHTHHGYHELCLVLDGSGIFRHGIAQYPLKRGTVFLSELDTPHEISSFSTRDLHLVFFCLTITPTAVPLTSGALDRIVHRFVGGHAASSPNGDRLAAYLGLICGSAEGGFAAVRRRESSLLFVMDALDMLTSSVGASELPQPDPANPDPVQRAIAFIEANLGRQFSVCEVADACFCSERHLRRVFRLATGKTVLDAANERRMLQAGQRLLMRFTVAQVAEMFGIGSPAHFSRLFRRYNGMSPKRFQMQHAPKAVVQNTSFRTAG